MEAVVDSWRVGYIDEVSVEAVVLGSTVVKTV